jgi:hypothetical protein
MKRYYLFDYIWYIGEALRKKGGNPSSGSLTLSFVWWFGLIVRYCCQRYSGSLEIRQR